MNFLHVSRRSFVTQAAQAAAGMFAGGSVLARAEETVQLPFAKGERRLVHQSSRRRPCPGWRRAHRIRNEL
jgi:hypothetical protein